MAKSGPIVIIEDDVDDQEIITEVIKELGIPNEIITFFTCPDAFNFLKSTDKKPFIILCDINLPKQSGLEFKKQVDNDPYLRKRSIPFIFLSTAAGQHPVTEAYTEMSVQGFFKKPSTVEELRRAISLINDYWRLCKHPNSEE